MSIKKTIIIINAQNSRFQPFFFNLQKVKFVKELSTKFARLEFILFQIVQIQVIFSHNL